MKGMSLRVELESLLGSDGVREGVAARRVYSCDAYSVERSEPDFIVFPTSTEEVSGIVRLCQKYQTPFTPRGAGTGLSGGAMAAKSGVLISTKRLTSILAVDIPNRRLHAQAGVVNSAITRAVQGYGLHFAPDPSSQTVSTLGGNIAENSGGPHTLKYGVTAQHILRLTVVLPDGEIVTIGGLESDCPAPDLITLFVGSEGTLGIVTDAWVKLTPNPAAIRTALAAFTSVEAATHAVSNIIAAGILPAALELMDRNILVALKAGFGLDYDSRTQALLLLEADGAEGSTLDECNQMERLCDEQGAISFVVAENDTERAKLWTARKKGVGAMGRLAPAIVTHDGVIPRSKLPEMLAYVYEVAARHELGVANLFHAGDGNLHPCFYFDDRIPGKIEAVVAAGEEIIRQCVELGGSVSGEHGIGVEKSDLLSLMYSEIDLEMQAKVLGLSGSVELSNPCKVIPNQKGCTEHKRRWRGVAT